MIATTAGILEALEMGVVVLDDRRCVRQWNAWMVRTAGLPGDRAIGQAIGSLFPSIAGTRLDSAIEEALGSGASSLVSDSLHGQVLPLRTADGRPLRHNVLISRIEEGPSPCCLLQVQDVTAHRDTEAALRRSEGRARARLAEVEALYDAAPIGLGLFDREMERDNEREVPASLKVKCGADRRAGEARP